MITRKSGKVLLPVNFNVEQGLLEQFKQKCCEHKRSMGSVLNEFIEGYLSGYLLAPPEPIDLDELPVQLEVLTPEEPFKVDFRKAPKTLKQIWAEKEDQPRTPKGPPIWKAYEPTNSSQ